MRHFYALAALAALLLLAFVAVVEPLMNAAYTVQP